MRVGELAPQADQWADLTDEPYGTAGPMRYLVHRDPAGDIDGIAHFRTPWSARIEETGTLVVEALEALTADAYRALWALLTDIDLTRTIVAPGRPLDEPLRWLLRNPRAMRITRQSDSLWLRLLDVPAALQERTYDTPVDLVIAVEQDVMCPDNIGVWRLVGGAGEATCARVDSAADLSMDIPSLGALYLGGMSASLLAAAGHIRQHRHGALTELGRAFRRRPRARQLIRLLNG